MGDGGDGEDGEDGGLDAVCGDEQDASPTRGVWQCLAMHLIGELGGVGQPANSTKDLEGLSRRRGSGAQLPWTPRITLRLLHVPSIILSCSAADPVILFGVF